MRIHAIETGRVTVRRRQLEGVGHGTTRVLRTLADREWAPPLPIRAWLIEHPEGLILIDTGTTARAQQPGYRPRWHPYSRAIHESVSAEDELGPQLRARGVSPADIRWVVLTHLHPDHTGGLEYVLDRDIIVTRPELAYAAGRHGILRGYLPHRWPSRFAPRTVTLADEPYGPFPRSLALTHARDVVLVDTPGHTPGHVSVIVEPEDGPRLLFAGDATYAESLMLRGVVDGVATDDAQAARTLARLRQLVLERPTIVLPTHDPAAPTRLLSASRHDRPALADRRPDAAAKHLR